MKFYDALEILKKGGTVERAGRKYRLAQGGFRDVTDAEETRHAVSEDERKAEDWEETKG